MATEPIAFAIPTRAIFTDQDQRAFAKSATCARLLGFARACNMSVRGLRVCYVSAPLTTTALESRSKRPSTSKPAGSPTSRRSTSRCTSETSRSARGTRTRRRAHKSHSFLR